MCTKSMKVLNWIAVALVVIGGINWGLVGLFDFNVVAAVFGAMSVVTRVVYVAVAVAAVYVLFLSVRCCKNCKTCS